LTISRVSVDYIMQVRRAFRAWSCIEGKRTKPSALFSWTVMREDEKIEAPSLSLSLSLSRSWAELSRVLSFQLTTLATQGRRRQTEDQLEWSPKLREERPQKSKFWKRNQRVRSFPYNVFWAVFYFTVKFLGTFLRSLLKRKLLIGTEYEKRSKTTASSPIISISFLNYLERWDV